MTLEKFLSIRNVYFLLFGLCLFLVCFAVYLQTQYGMQPCHLCILQRMVFSLLGLVSVSAALVKPYRKGLLIFGYSLLGLSILGGLIAARHVWIQHYPQSLYSCGLDFFTMLEQLPLLESIRVIFQGSGVCQTTGPLIFHLSVAEWAAVFFSVYFVVIISQLYRTHKMKGQ